MIYKILSRTQWSHWQSSGRYSGSAVDLQDGFIHLSTAAQLLETRRRHFVGEHDLLLIGLDPGSIPSEQLRYERSRSGDLFPHVYGQLQLMQARTVEAIGAQDGQLLNSNSAGAGGSRSV